MTSDEFRHKMKKIKHRAKDNTEAAHAEAQDLMIHTLKLSGYLSGMDVYEQIQKFYALRKANG